MNNSLTQAEKRIAIAERLGYVRSANKSWTDRVGMRWLLPNHDRNILHFWVKEGDIPDYFRDLHATYEAVKLLTTKQRESFETQLIALFCEWDLAEAEPTVRDVMQAIHASAEQRAEALGCSLNLW